MNVAHIAAPPILRSIGKRLPNSAQVKPNTARMAIAMVISPGTAPVRTNPAINATSSKYTGRGMMPIRNSITRHQPEGQKDVDAVASGAEVVCCIGSSYGFALDVRCCLGHEPTLRRRRAGVHVATAIDVIVDLCRAAQHARVEKDGERRGLQRLLGEGPIAIRLPEHRQ